ncbi:hypothetical protein [Sphingobacterium sp. LRF_L2]|uniref:hypothetical protein n=1 Tax=Sphingobacterium sp. LRF_L2 TaxID=3369421 RepID=UPI003F634181
MTIEKVHTLRYSIAYRVAIILLLFLIFHFIAITTINLVNNKSLDILGWILCTLKIVVGSIFSYLLLNYLIYIFSWKAIVTKDGCVVKDIKQVQRKFNWSNGDILAMESYNLLLINNPAEKVAKNYRLSSWLTNKRALIDSHLAYLKTEDFSEFYLKEEVMDRMYDQTVTQYYQHLSNNKGNKLFLGFIITLLVTGVLFFSLIGQFLYTDFVMLIIICLGIGIQLHTLIQSWNLFSPNKAFIIAICTVFSVLYFGITMFSNTYVMNELYFIKWGLIFSAFATSFIRLFVDNRKRGVPLKLSIPLYAIVFSLLSVYFISFLKVGNMAGNIQGYRWERGIVTSKYQLTIFHSVFQYVAFENEQLGEKLLDLNFLGNDVTEGVTDIEVRVQEGNLGIPWFYKIYENDHEDEVRTLQALR